MKIWNWYKTLKGLRKVGVIMTAIMLFLFMVGPFLKAIPAAFN